MCESAMMLLRALASLKLTLLGIAMLLVAVLLSYFNQEQSDTFLIPPLALLALNLLAAIVFNPRIRQNSGLLMFHLCLLSIAALTILSQLTSMKGRVEITQGSAFDAGSVTVIERGAWHRLDALQQVEFVQRDIQVDYATGLRRGPTRSHLQLNADNDVIVGDNVAFKSHGYRFYTTSNKGFAAIVNWHAKDGRVERGAIHFPSYPLYDWKQHNNWQAPSGEQLGFSLVIETPLERDRDWQLHGVDHGQLTLSLPDGSRRTVVPGEIIELEHGLLEFEAIRMWMGYKIFYDPLLAWFFAFALVGVAGIAWHYSLKLSTTNTLRSFAGNRAGKSHAVSTSRS